MTIDKYEKNLGSEYAASLPTLGEAMAEVLSFFGVETIFGVGGDFAAHIISALENAIEIAPSSNEMHAGFSACGQAEIQGIGVALTTYTVGSLPCTSAAALAKTERLPVIFISGAPGEQEVMEGTLHHTVASYTTWRANYDCALDAFAALGIKSERLQGARSPEQPNMAAEHFFQLVAHAFLNKEPVFIEVPRDLVLQKTQALQLPASPSDISPQTFVLKGADMIARQIEQKLKNSQFPLVYIGENVKLNQPLKQQLMSFCHKHQIPFATSWLAKGVFDESDPLCLGNYNGVFSPAFARQYIEKKVDYVLEVDTSVYRQDTSAAFNTGTHHILNFENKTTIKGTVQNSEGLRRVFDYLLDRSEIPVYSIDINKPEIAAVDQNDKIDFHNLTRCLNQLQRHSDRAFIYLPEVGNSFFASYGLVCHQSSIGRGWLTNPWYAAMGTSIPYARAVCKLLKRKRFSDVAILITGDGGFNFQHNELVHFLRERLNLIIIYMRNNIFHLGKSSDADIYQCSTPELNVQQLIAAYGGQGFRVETVADFMTTMHKLVSRNQGLTLVEIAASTEPKYQCEEIRLLNLYIRYRNGDPEATAAWKKLTQ
jgi:thiamine pyrophosphate-dependent acetolactate synthase large subunit-like protein